MSDNAEKKQSWWLTLPGLLTAMTGFIGAITALIIGLNQVGLFGSFHLAVAFRHQGADDLLGIVRIHLTPEGLDVESLH